MYAIVNFVGFVYEWNLYQTDFILVWLGKENIIHHMDIYNAVANSNVRIDEQSNGHTASTPKRLPFPT